MTLLELIQQLFTDGIRITILIEPNDRVYESHCGVCDFRARSRTEQGAQDALKQHRAQCRRDDCPAISDFPDWLKSKREFK